MRAVILQHVPFEGPGYIEHWLREQGIGIDRVLLYEPGAALPDPSRHDLAVVMGGPMSVNESDKFPWLAGERELLRARVSEDRPTLGICLGAQAIASALGSRVYRAPEREIGWFPVYGTEATEGGFTFPPSLIVLHWHGETFDLPEGAVRLASSEVCENQAFQVGRRVIGLQFHLEATRESLRALVTHAKDDLSPAGRFVSTESDILAVTDDVLTQANLWMARVLEYVLS